MSDSASVPSPTPPWVAIQRNPSSGSGRRAGVVLELIRELRARGLRPRLFAKRAAFDAAVNDSHRRASLMGAVAAGGDGTVLDLVNRHPDLPISILPLGTENLLAKAFGIPRCGRTVAEVIARSRRQRIDVGWINDRRFLIMASVGFDAQVVHQLHAKRSGGHITHWSYLGPIWNCLRRFPPPTVRVTVEDEPAVHEGEMVVVANLRSYALNLGLVPTADGTDGMLDARIFRTRTLSEMVRQFLRVLRGRQESSSDVLKLRGRRIRIESDHPVPIQADGDPAGMTPVELRIEPLAVEFIVP